MRRTRQWKTISSHWQEIEVQSQQYVPDHHFCMCTILNYPRMQLLYSTKSISCYINPEYSDPANFDQVMDIFATQSLSSSNLIESQFNAISSKYYWYSPSLLNDSASVIQTAIVNHTVPETSYLFATLTASNATDTSGSSGSGSTTTGTDSSGDSNPGGGNTNTSLAMWALLLLCHWLLFSDRCVFSGSFCML